MVALELGAAFGMSQRQPEPSRQNLVEQSIKPDHAADRRFDQQIRPALPVARECQMLIISLERPGERRLRAADHAQRDCSRF